MYLVFFTGHIGKDEPFLLKYNAAEEPNSEAQALSNISMLT